MSPAPKPPQPEYKLPRSFFERDARSVAQDLVGRFLFVQPRNDNPITAQLTHVAAYAGSEKSSAPTLKYAPGMIGISVKYGSRLIDIACQQKGKPSCITLRAGIVYRVGKDPMFVDGPGNLSKALGFGDHMDSTPIDCANVWFAGQTLPDYLVSRIKNPKQTTPNHLGTFVLEPQSVEHLLREYLGR